jgi:hypothetical protein
MELQLKMEGSGINDKFERCFRIKRWRLMNISAKNALLFQKQNL